MSSTICPNQCYLQSKLVRGKSRLVRMVSVPPVKFIAPESHASGALCFISNYGGGMLGGDSVAIDIEVCEESSLVLLPQANSRAYTNTDSKLATQFMNIHIKANGYFIYNADPLVLHENSRYLQDTTLSLDNNASAILIDWFSIGRSENGERFLFSEYSSSFTVSNSKSTFLIDRQHLSPHDVKYNKAGSFADYSQMLNIFFVGDSIPVATIFENNKSLSNNRDYIFSFTHNENYVILRILGKSRQCLQNLLHSLYSIIAMQPAIGFNALERKM